MRHARADPLALTAVEIQCQRGVVSARSVISLGCNGRIMLMLVMAKVP